jgi:hypothetical protein
MAHSKEPSNHGVPRSSVPMWHLVEQLLGFVHHPSARVGAEEGIPRDGVAVRHFVEQSRRRGGPGAASARTRRGACTRKGMESKKERAARTSRQRVSAARKEFQVTTKRAGSASKRRREASRRPPRMSAARERLCWRTSSSVGPQPRQRPRSRLAGARRPP